MSVRPVRSTNTRDHLDRLAREAQAENEGMSYDDALAQVITRNPSLIQTYTEQLRAEAGSSADEKALQRAEELREANPDLDEAAALEEAVRDPQIAACLLRERGWQVDDPATG